MNTQRGSIHVVVISVLVVALSAALGVIFYQNFIAKPATTTTDTSSQQQQSSSLTKTQIAYGSTIYEFEHPDNWTVAVSDQKTVSLSENTLTMTSKDQTVQVLVRLSHNSPDESCDTTDGLKLRYYDVHRTRPITTLTKESQYIVEAVTDAQGGGYSYAIGLAPDSGETHAALGDPKCTVKDIGLAAVYPQGSNSAVPTIYVNILFPKIVDEKTKKVKSIQDVTEMLKTDDYKATMAILESGRQK